MTSPRRTYAEVDHWRSYQEFLPERLRIAPGREPAEEWTRWRDADIHLDRFAQPDAPLTVMLLHGGGGCGRLLAPFGRLLYGHGYEVVAPDLPGYGLSVAPRSLFSYRAWVDCVVDLAAAETARTGRPVVLFGMSVGGYLAYLAAAQGRNVAGVMVTTLADPRLPIVRDQFARHPQLNRLLYPFLPAVSAIAGGVRLPIRWFANMRGIANHPDVSQLLSTDPVAGGIRAPLSFMHSLLAITPAIEPEQFDVCPVLLAHPGADRWTQPDSSLPFFNRIKGPKRYLELDNCGHFPIEEPGVTQLEQAMTDFLAAIPAPEPLAA
jgi:alpha-beta hydrolase superfamily lysophospholipase